jgi:DNA polymerase-3 subunit beta
MKFECKKEKIKKYINLADKITSKNSTLPILKHILLEVYKKKLIIKATNLDIGVEFTIPVKTENEGKIAVPGTILNNSLSYLTDENLIINFIDGNLKISTKNNTSILIKSEKADDFPILPKIKNKESFFISTQKLIQGLKSVWYSSAVSDIKPEISSVFIYPDDEVLVFTATDSFRLAEKRIIQKNINEFNGIIIPFKNINEIIRVFEENKGDIEIISSKNQISFYSQEIHLTSRIIDGIFPDYKQIIPKEYKTEVIVLKQDLIDSLKLINVFSDKFNKVNIKIIPKENIFTLNSKNETGENTSNIKATIKGEEISLSFNYKYIMDCFQAINSYSVILQFNKENNPMVIKSVGDNSFIYLVMPINK